MGEWIYIRRTGGPNEYIGFRNCDQTMSSDEVGSDPFPGGDDPFDESLYSDGALKLDEKIGELVRSMEYVRALSQEVTDELPPFKGMDADLPKRIRYTPDARRIKEDHYIEDNKGVKN
jgi:hypothetical protein